MTNNKFAFVVMWCLLALGVSAVQAGTVAYWELDGAYWDLKDSVAWYDTTPSLSVVGDSNLKANPIPNPDTSLPWAGDGDDAATNPLASWLTGSGQYWYVPNVSDSTLHDRTFDFYPEKSFTIDGWFRPIASGIVIGNQHSSSDPIGGMFGGSYKGWRINTLDGGHTLYFEVDGTAASGEDVIITYDPCTFLPDPEPNDYLYGNLHHFAAVYDAAQLQIALYVDGMLVGTNDIPESWISDTWTVHRGGALAIGARDSGDGSFGSLRFKGGLDELRFSNIALKPKDFLNAERTVAYFELDGAAWAADEPNNVVDGTPLTVVGSPADSALRIDPIPNPDRSLPWFSGSDAATNEKATFFTSSDGVDAFYIPNTNDPCTHDTTFDFHPDKSFTVDGWFRAKNSGTIVGNAHSGAASHQLNGGYTGWRFYTTGNGTVLNFVCDGSATGDSVSLTTPIEYDTLHHFAGAYDADTGELRLYLDGKLVASDIVPETWNFNRGGALAIGARDAGTGFNSFGFTGAIDEIRYSAFAFTEADLLNYVKPVIAYWELDGASWDGRDSVGDMDMTIVGAITDSSLVVDPIPNRETASPWWGQTADDEFYNPRAAWFNAGVAAYVPNSNDPGLHDDTFDLILENSFTVDGWFRPTNSGTIIGNQHSILSSHQVNGSYKGWRVYTTDGGVTLNFAADGAAGSDGNVVLSGACQADVLQHFAAVYDADAGEMKLYLDGFLIDSDTVPGTWSSHRGGSVAVGGRDTGDGLFNGTDYVGAIDEIRLVNRALAPSEFLSPSTQSELQCGDYGYLSADFNQDCYVNFDDLVALIGNWLSQQ